MTYDANPYTRHTIELKMLDLIGRADREKEIPQVVTKTI